MLQASDLTKAHDGAPLFDGLSFVLGDGERAGLVGPNGVGKSTLLRLLAGVDRPDRGAVADRRRASASAGCRRRRRTPRTTLGELLGAGLGELWTVRGELHALLARLAEGDTSPATLERYGHAQERFEALGGWALEAVARRGAPRAGHRPPRRGHAAGAAVGRRAGARAAGGHAAGRRRRCCCSTSRPTTSTATACSWLEDWLRGFAGTVVVVSHDRAFLDAVVGCILELEPGGALTRYEGGYSDHRAERERRRAKLALDYEAQEKRRRRLEADIATTRRQAQHTETHREPRRGAEAQALRQEGGAEGEGARGAAAARARGRRRGDAARRAPGAAAAPGGPRARAPARRRAARRALARAGRRRPHAASRRPRRGDRAQRRRQDDAARRPLRRARAGRRARSSWPGAARVLPQTPIALPADERVVDWLRAQAALDEGAARTLLGAFALDTAAVHRPLGRLSPGERARVHMAAMVASGAELLLLDEPTNHLDPETLEAVEAALRAFGGHDRRGLPRPRLPRGARGDAAHRGARRARCARSA